ncbi:MAG: hypothetical protein JRC68_03410 [Deltaproteobacteria bacterium]|nr:hypothetical protein [Deltaproteobacteria bacterium]
MTNWAFEDSNLKTVSDALDIAEDKIGDFYKFSFGQWKRHRYDVKTLSYLSDNEITSYAFALLNKCSGAAHGFESKTRERDFYFICLQDHQILKAMKRDNNLKLLPLLVYVFTHELVHIVRFCNFFQRFEIGGQGKESEERLVHATTYEILNDLALPNLDYILESYHGHRICDMVAS